MEMISAIAVMSALAQPTRLAVYTMLAARGEDGMAAGQIASGTGTPATTLSAHLVILTHAGLVASTRSGRSIVYRALPEPIEELAALLSGLRSGMSPPT